MIGVHAELRSRGAAEPRLPEPPEPDVRGALRQAAAVAAEALTELKPGSANHELVERALALLDGTEEPAGPRRDGRAADRQQGETDGRLQGGDRGGAEPRRRGRRGRPRLPPRRRAAASCSPSASRSPRRRRAGIDFEDLQLLAARLLERTETGAAYRARFSHLLVDEFQDTNRLQLRLIEALRGPKCQLMVVGDELQSIYGFRHADLDVFRERREAIEASAGGEAIPLSGNFRSRPEVIGAVNAIGERAC